MKMGRKDQTQAQFRKAISELKRKIKQISHDSAICDQDMKELALAQQNMSQQLESKQSSLQPLRSEIESFDAEIEQLQEASNQLNLMTFCCTISFKA